MAKRLIEAEALIKSAKDGEKLDADKRRHAVGYLMSTQPELTNLDLATLFDVSERTITEDRRNIRQQAAELVTQEDIALVIADIRLSYERYQQQLASSLKKATQGTRVYLDHLNSGMQMQVRVVEALQSLGWYPKNLGQLTKKEFRFEAHVTKDGTVDTRPVELLDHLVDTPKLTGDDAERRKILDAEFSDLPATEQDNADPTRPEADAGIGT
jgi:hypothetical protein